MGLSEREEAHRGAARGSARGYTCSEAREATSSLPMIRWLNPRATKGQSKTRQFRIPAESKTRPSPSKHFMRNYPELNLSKPRLLPFRMKGNSHSCCAMAAV